MRCQQFKVAKAALADGSQAAKAVGSDLRRKMWKHIFRELVGRCTRLRLCCIVHGSPAKAGRPKRGRSEGSALWHNHESGSPGKQIELQPAYRCNLRRQRAGLPQGNSILSVPATALKLGLKTVQAIGVVGNGHFDWKPVSKSPEKGQ